MAFDRGKFKQLVHYVMARAGDQAGFGSTKLNEVLWLAEAHQHMLTGKPIAGADYVREQDGPVAKPMMAIRDELARERAIEIMAPRSALEGWRFKSLRPPDMAAFSPAELQVVDECFERFVANGAAQPASEEARDQAWAIARVGEPLPFSAFLASRVRKPTQEEMDWARAAAQRVRA